jgi:hypothetical protein
MRFSIKYNGRVKHPMGEGQEGKSFAVSLKIRATGFAGHSSAKLKPDYGYSLSSGERVRVRASVKHQFSFAIPSHKKHS